MNGLLYKYFPLDSDEQLSRIERVLGGWLYFSSPTTFNDPFEMRPLLAPPTRDDFDEVVSRIGLGAGLLSKSAQNKTFRAVAQEMQRTARSAVAPDWLDSIGVLCLTTKSDDLLMWAHYASNHTGICIGFEPSSKPFANARKVQYEEDRPRVRAFELERQDEDLLNRVLCTKSPHWRYEAEWRCLKRPIRNQELKYYQELTKNDPDKNNEIAELLATEGGPGQYEFDSLAIRRIYLGARMSLERQQEVIEMQCRVGNTARIYQMDLDPRYFKLQATKRQR
jgi:hypothetical protein